MKTIVSPDLSELEQLDFEVECDGNHHESVQLAQWCMVMSCCGANFFLCEYHIDGYLSDAESAMGQCPSCNRIHRTIESSISLLKRIK